MSEEPKQIDKDTHREKKEGNRWGRFKEYFRDNPTLVLTLMYVDLTGIGILYSLIYYRQFEINIFDFAELGDFLLAAFKAPAVTFFVLLTQILLLGSFSLCLRVLLPQRRPQSLVQAPSHSLFLRVAIPGLVSIMLTTRQVIFLTVTLMVLGSVVIAIATAIIPLRLALSQADAIKQSEQAQATVQYRKYSSSSTGQVTKSGLKLMGSTQRVVFFYDDNEGRTIVIPQAQIVSIEVPE